MLEFFASKEDLRQGLNSLEMKVDDKISSLHNEMLTHFDEQLVILRRLDQERVLRPSIFVELKKELGRQKDIKILKVQLAIA